MEDIIIGCSPITKTIFAGKLNKAKTMWLKKVDVTQYFYDCVIRRFEGTTEIIEDGENKWEITVKKLK